MSGGSAHIGERILGQTPGLRRVWLFLFVAALYVLLALTVHLRLWAEFDLAATQFLDRVPRALDPPLSVFSLIGSAEVTGLVVLAYALFVCPTGSRVRLIVLFALIAFVEWIGKNVVFQPGPPAIFYHSVLPFSFPTFRVGTPFSFPSGHSARSVFVIFVLVVWIRHSRLGAQSKHALLGVLATGETLLLATRVSLGEHWSTDVIGGTLLATALVLPWLYSLKPASFPLFSKLSVQPGSK